jgi:hypothetical protein
MDFSMNPMNRFTYFVEIRRGRLPPRRRAVPIISHIDSNKLGADQPSIQWVPGLFPPESKAVKNGGAVLPLPHTSCRGA